MFISYETKDHLHFTGFVSLIILKSAMIRMCVLTRIVNYWRHRLMKPVIYRIMRAGEDMEKEGNGHMMMACDNGADGNHFLPKTR